MSLVDLYFTAKPEKQKISHWGIVTYDDGTYIYVAVEARQFSNYATPRHTLMFRKESIAAGTNSHRFTFYERQSDQQHALRNDGVL